VRAVALGVTDERAAIAAVQLAVDVLGRLDLLVNNAGYGNLAAIEDTTIQDFRAQLETNLFGVVNLTNAAIPVMRRQGAGRILQFSSVGGRVGPIGRGAYAAAKWGVEGFSEVLAKEVGPLGIKVTIIEPGSNEARKSSGSHRVRVLLQALKDNSSKRGCIEASLLLKYSVLRRNGRKSLDCSTWYETSSTIHPAAVNASTDTVMHTFVPARGSLCEISVGTRLYTML
jgi:NAD(P)-dependent dehydrogenase (short-subunit alcohol dehydrogenase family)